MILMSAVLLLIPLMGIWHALDSIAAAIREKRI